MSEKGITTEERLAALHTSRTTPVTAALAAVVWAAALAVLTILPEGGEQLNAPADYADLIVFLLGVVLFAIALTGLQRWQGERTGRLGQVGYWLTVAPLALLAIQTTAELLVGHETLDPLFPIGALASRLGLILWGIASYRAAVLPRWLGPALAIAWFIFPPLGPVAAAVLLPVVWAVAAVALWRPVGSAS